MTRPELRRTMGAQARRYWESRHTLSRMADACERLMLDAAGRPVPAPPLPAHLIADGVATTRRILSELGVGELPW
jgi:hypothetical protein